MERCIAEENYQLDFCHLPIRIYVNKIELYRIVMGKCNCKNMGWTFDIINVWLTSSHSFEFILLHKLLKKKETFKLLSYWIFITKKIFKNIKVNNRNPRWVHIYLLTIFFGLLTCSACRVLFCNCYRQYKYFC